MSQIIKDLQLLSTQAEIAIEKEDPSDANGLKNQLENKKAELEKDDVKEYLLNPEDPNSPTFPKEKVLKMIEEDIKNISYYVQKFPGLR